MPRRYHTIALLIGAGLLVSAAAAFAAKPAPEVTPLDGPIHGAGPFNVNSTCTIGVTGAPAAIVNYLLPPNDRYYTLIRSADCPTCTGPGGVEAEIAKVALNFRVACSVPVEISIVGATGSAACRTPDLTNVILPPVATSFSAPAAGNYEFSTALPPGICLNGDAFLVVNFVADGACNTSSTRPRLIVDGACDPCVSYNFYPGGNDELCTVGFGGNPVMKLDVVCCSVVPTQQRSWGELKIRYSR